MERTDNPKVRFALKPELKSTLLRPRLVRQDVYVQRLAPHEADTIREALRRGLTPTSLKVVEDTLILRFDLKEG